MSVVHPNNKSGVEKYLNWRLEWVTLSIDNSPMALMFSGTVREWHEVKGRLVYNTGREDRNLTEEPKTPCWSRTELINRALRAQGKEKQNTPVVSQRGGRMQNVISVSKYGSKAMSNVKLLYSTAFLSTYPCHPKYIKNCSYNNKLNEIGSRSPKNKTGIACCQGKPQIHFNVQGSCRTELPS